MAAAGTPIQELCEEATCSICLGYFRDPVMVAECGHNFCRACLTQYSGELDTQASCPQCRGIFQKRNLRPNRQLANVAEIAKKFGGQEVKGAEGKGQFCEKHQEPLKLFCKDHEAPICVVCDKAKEHEGHKVVPLEETSQQYQDLICRHLEILKKKRGRVLANKANTERKNQNLLKQIEVEREKTVAQFRQLHQFLEEQEKHLLAQVDELEEEIARKRAEHLARLSKELSSLENSIREMEEKCQKPASELLQDVRSILQSRSEKETFENPVAFPPELKWKIWDFCDINPFLKEIIKQFKDSLLSGLQLKKANVTLDPDTAYPWLILSKDLKSVRMGDKRQCLPNNPERFSCYTFVLGREGFTRGRHFWDVGVENKGDWAVGVAQKSVKRKGKVESCPEEGFWVAGNLRGTYYAFYPPYYLLLPLCEELKRIRVSLSCDEGRVAFYDADRGTLLHAFSGVSFAGQTLLPFFEVHREAQLRISP